MTNDRWLTAPEVATMLGVSVSTVRRYLVGKILFGRKHLAAGQHGWLINPASVRGLRACRKGGTNV